jgi:uncharacterized protein YkwD
MKRTIQGLLISLLVSLLFAACEGQSIVIPWQGQTIEIAPIGAAAQVATIEMTSTNTPFMPIPDSEGDVGLTAAAVQQLSTSTVTETPTLLLMSETPLSLTVTGTFTPSVTLTGTLANSLTPSLTSTATRTQTGTLVLSSQTPSRTYTGTQVPTRTNTRTNVPPQSTGTVTQTSVQSTRTYTVMVENTSTFTAVVINTPTYTATSVPSGCVYSGNSAYESTLIGLINDLRSSLSLSPLSANSLLGNAARDHSQDMACNDYFSHTGLDGSSASSRVAAAGYSYSWVGENIYAGSGSYGTPQQAYDTWLNSPAHYDNMTNPNYTEIGIGFISCADSTYQNYFTANFARP